MNLDATFGMFEMERAAEKIILASRTDDGQWKDVSFDDLWPTLDSQCQTGLLQLLLYGWLCASVVSKRHFGVTAGFIDRVKKRI